MASNTNPGRWQFWIDRGGTFTDVVARRPDGTHLVEPGWNIYSVVDAGKPAVCGAATALFLDRTLKAASVPAAEVTSTSSPYFIRLRGRGARLVQAYRGA